MSKRRKAVFGGIENEVYGAGRRTARRAAARPRRLTLSISEHLHKGALGGQEIGGFLKIV